MNIKQKIDDRLNTMFNFKRVGEWYRQGVCPQCGKKELFTHAENPRIVKCGRLNKCGYEEHVKDICQDLFKDWSKEFPRTKESPTATAKSMALMFLLVMRCIKGELSTSMSMITIVQEKPI